MKRLFKLTFIDQEKIGFIVKLDQEEAWRVTKKLLLWLIKKTFFRGFIG